MDISNYILILLIAIVFGGFGLVFFFMQAKSVSFRSTYQNGSSKAFIIITVLLTVTASRVLIATRITSNRNNDGDRERQQILLTEAKLLQYRLSLQFKKDSILKRDILADSTILVHGGDKKFQGDIELRLSKIEENLRQQAEVTNSLRQAINPIRPEEVLTIARLKDQIVSLDKTVSTLDSNLKIRQQNFEESTTREITSSGNSTTLIIVVLIPLVVNLLYSVWKDFKKPDKDGKTESNVS